MKTDPKLLNYGISAQDYLSCPEHKLLARDIDPTVGPNIGRYGHNLTISCLSCNRSHLTLRLLESLEMKIPFFKGEFLIIDNGSSADEIKVLEAAARRSPLTVRIELLGANFGVGGGRNRTIPFLGTEWVMFLDNDIYLTGDPFPEVQEAISTLGCHFLNVPLLDKDGATLFANGGHLYGSVQGEDFHLGAGSAFQQIAVDNFERRMCFLSTFLFGGASVLRKETFTRIGGFDEGMFIGFEDLDFSLRLFREGMKVGNVQSFVFVHAHEVPETGADVQYEKVRFSRSILHKSAQHFEQKHGFKVWSTGVDAWLVEQERRHGFGDEQGTDTETTTETPIVLDPVVHIDRPIRSSSRPRIALVVDSEEWAFGNIARQLKRYLSDEFDFTIIPADIIDGNIVRLLGICRGYDLVHIFWREFAYGLSTKHFAEYLGARGIDAATYLTSFFDRTVLSVSVYDHLFLEPQEAADREVLFRHIADGYYVSSEKLRAIYAGIPYYPAPLAVLPDGVDHGKFYPMNLDRLYSAVRDRPLRIGWSGNSKWAFELFDFKGLHSILKPAVEMLQAEGLPIECAFADRQDRMIPHEEMVYYYGSIDLYVCPSMIEGTPNPVLESMACGVPVISTDVGIVKEAFGPLQREFILPERSVEALVACLRRILSTPELLSKLSEENIRSIERWDWCHKAAAFRAYFSTLLRTHGDRARDRSRVGSIVPQTNSKEIAA